MFSPAVLIVLGLTLLALSMIVGFLIYVCVKYTPIVSRNFEVKPIFLPLRITPTGEGEEVRFRTKDGLDLVGTYLKARTARRAGVMVFCHEYLSDRWSALPYVDALRDRGFDLFSFDFRNHGQSERDPAYEPLQWVTDHELADLRGALDYLRTRSDADLAGVGLFGVSRGGGTALCVAGRDPRVWSVITDGAFPTRGTLLSYMLRWAEIYVSNRLIWKLVPVAVFDFVGWVSRRQSQARLGCRYASVERGAARIAPRPWLSIHGERDNYIGLDIAKGLFNRAGEPKELWVVEGAKHNRSRDKDPIAYLGRITSFLGRYAPRAMTDPQPEPVIEERVTPPPTTSLHDLPIQADLAVPVSG